MRALPAPAGWPVVLVCCEPVSDTGARLDVLSAAERERWQRLRRDADRRRFLTGRLLARALLATRLGVSPAAVPLGVARDGSPAARSGAGRPVVGGMGAAAPSVSIAHAAQRVIVAVGDGVDVGVDVEPVGGASAHELWPSMCAPAERARLTALAPPMAEAVAVALWTRKEAVLKACGHGLAVPMSAVQIADDPAGPCVTATAAPLPPPHRLRIADLDVGAGYRASVAIVLRAGTGVPLSAP